MAKFTKVTLDSFSDYAAHKDSWTADSVPVQKIAKLATALRNGGTAKAIGETAKFLKEQGKVETVLPDYSPYVSAKFVTE